VSIMVGNEQIGLHKVETILVLSPLILGEGPGLGNNE